MPLCRRVKQIGLGGLELGEGFKAAVVDVGHVLEVSVEPDLADAAGKMREKFHDRGLGEIFEWDTGDEDRAGLVARRVGGADEETLARAHEVMHFLLDVVPNPDCTTPVSKRISDDRNAMRSSQVKPQARIK